MQSRVTRRAVTAVRTDARTHERLKRVPATVARPWVAPPNAAATDRRTRAPLVHTDTPREISATCHQRHRVRPPWHVPRARSSSRQTVTYRGRASLHRRNIRDSPGSLFCALALEKGENGRKSRRKSSKPRPRVLLGALRPPIYGFPEVRLYKSF